MLVTLCSVVFYWTCGLCLMLVWVVLSVGCLGYLCLMFVLGLLVWFERVCGGSLCLLLLLVVWLVGWFIWCF